MATSDESRREHPNTYIVQDRSSEEELNRLRVQDKLTTSGMGGVLPEQPDISGLRRILDVGCGSGSWVIDAAQTYPELSVSGIDISKRMVEYAREQAKEQGVADRVEFRVMDALRMLEFPAGYFDLVNLRFGASWLRTWDWPKMLSELQRMTRPGGIVRVTEPSIVQIGNSPALTQQQEMFQCALFRAGHLFKQETTGITAQLSSLLHQHGIQNVQTKEFALEYRASTPEAQAFCEDWKHVFRTVRPFVQKWGCFSKDYDEICQQALKEMQQSDFHCISPVLTAWGTRP